MNWNYALAVIFALGVLGLIGALGALHVITGDQCMTAISSIVTATLVGGGVVAGTKVPTVPPGPPNA